MCAVMMTPYWYTYRILPDSQYLMRGLIGGDTTTMKVHSGFMALRMIMGAIKEALVMSLYHY